MKISGAYRGAIGPDRQSALVPRYLGNYLTIVLRHVRNVSIAEKGQN